MDSYKLELAKNEHIKMLNQILTAYRSTERKSKQILGFVVVVCAVALYFVLFDLLGVFWGLILTIAIVGVGFMCVVNLGITLKNAPPSDGKLAYQACVAMYTLIEIKKGTYRTDIANIICVSDGTHLDLYQKFIQLYPSFASKDLKKLATLDVQQKDIS